MIALLVVLLSGVAEPSAADPAVVVQSLYKEIIVRHPIGLPTGEDATALAPFLTSDLRRLLEDGRRCEDDYFRTHAGSDEKPTFPWLEDGLFSGGSEMALPTTFKVEDVKRLDPHRFEVRVRLTYKETFDTYGRPPDDRNDFDWVGVVTVNCSENVCGVDDYRVDRNGSTDGPSLREHFRDCRSGRWAGE